MYLSSPGYSDGQYDWDWWSVELTYFSAFVVFYSFCLFYSFHRKDFKSPGLYKLNRGEGDFFLQ